MSKHPDKALIYCRVSDTKQKLEGSGLESQEFRCRQFAAEKGYAVEEVFRDDVSGGGDYAKRPGMIALLNFLESHQEHSYAVIFDDLKRLARDTMFHWQLRHAMSNFGAHVECLNYTFEDTPEGEFMETIFAAQGQLERKQIGRQTRQKTQARLEAGYHAFIAPVGFKYIKSKTDGKILVKDEPAASIITEMMEGFASGRFQTKQEARRFLEGSALFPKTASGKIGNNRINTILANPLYAGYIEYKPWGVELRKGRHEGMVDYQTFLRIQERLEGRAYAPARKDLNLDFVMRGVVACECGNALTAAWSKSHTGKRYAYYVCQNRKCAYKGKSIRRERVEGEFETLLKKLSPSKSLVVVAEKMFKQLWEHHRHSQTEHKTQLEKTRGKLNRDIERLIDRIVDTDNSAVVNALEKRIEKLQRSRIALDEKIAACGRPLKPYEHMYRTAMQYLSNPHQLWACGGFVEKRAVLKLTLTERLVWDRKGLYRTPDLSLPFRMLGDFCVQKMQMVPGAGIEPARPEGREILSLSIHPILLILLGSNPPKTPLFYPNASRVRTERER
ncbi:MAG: recombinase family protein [Candidatus Thiodiazotropha sp. (ex Troendleina suluensis)]|nr:recombinase family protein [Candidatus Thiodiazotropha sp. (ex Troendleina suluensis)]